MCSQADTCDELWRYRSVRSRPDRCSTLCPLAGQVCALAHIGRCESSFIGLSDFIRSTSRENRFHLSHLWPLGIPRRYELIELDVVLASRLPVARRFRGARRPVDTPEAVRIALERALELGLRLCRLIQRQQHLTEQLTGGDDITRRYR